MNPMKAFLGWIIALELIAGFLLAFLTHAWQPWMIPFIFGTAYAASKGVIAITEEDEVRA